MMPEIIVIAHNIRSTHNVGSLFRTAEGFGVERMILSGYTPYPRTAKDTRLPHIADKLSAQIRKTALGAETMIPFEHQPEPDFTSLKAAGYVIVGLEQDGRSLPLDQCIPAPKIALVLGEEVAGIAPALREACDVLLEIPMFGKKESFNVSVAAGIALYGLMTKS